MKTCMMGVMLATLAGVAAAQPVQWRVEDGGNGHWYQGFSRGRETITWYAARDSAVSAGGYLASIRSDAEHAFVTSASVGGGSGLWANWYVGPLFGGFRSESGAWQWASGEPWSYTRFSGWFPGSGQVTHLDPAGWGQASPNGVPAVSAGYVGYIVEWSADCNGDGIVDKGQILSGQLIDANGDGVPDVCQCTNISVTGQPTNQSVCVGSPFTLAVTVSGTSPSFQWRRNGQAIPDATGASFTIGSASASDGGQYDCIATNACGSVMSSSAVVVVSSGPVIVEQPQSQMFVPGGTAVFSVVAAGANPSFQWRRNGVSLTNGTRISGVNMSQLRISAAVTSDQGIFDCVVQDVCGTGLSATAELSCKPVVTRQPEGGSFVGGQPVMLSVEASTATSYRWRRDGVALTNGSNYQGVTTPSLTINAADPSLSGSYSVSITNPCGSTPSRAALVVVTCPADFNDDGGIDGQDTVSFFESWEAGLPFADLNFDGGTDGSDVSAFFERWENGC